MFDYPSLLFVFLIKKCFVNIGGSSRSFCLSFQDVSILLSGIIELPRNLIWFSSKIVANDFGQILVEILTKYAYYYHMHRLTRKQNKMV